MGIKWTDEQINALLRKAKEMYEIDIPLATEIRHLNHFVFEMSTFSTGDDSFKFKVKHIAFAWFHKGREKSEEIEIPEEVAWKVFHEARAILDTKCNRLTDMLGLNKRTIKK